jgi:enoyl-CoA hydratase/carnithine racemase
MSVEAHVIVEKVDRVLVMTLNRPERRNALTLAMYSALVEGLEQAANDATVRAVLIQGSGGQFTSGNDLKDFMSSPPTGPDSPVFDFLRGLVHMPKPVVAAVEGWAVGIGLTMLMHCDLVYADAGARFQVPFVNLGLVPEAGSSLMLPAMMGHARAARLLLLGDKIDARTAYEMGLVSEVVESDVAGYAMAKAHELASRAPEAMRLSKEFMKKPLLEQLEKVMVDEAVVFADRLGSAECAEAIGAFFEKREPDFG